MNWLKLFTHPGKVLPTALREHRGQIRIESGDGATTADTLHFGRDNAGTMEWVDLTAGGGGAVDSVNGQTGTVVLDQDDVGDGATYKQYNPASVSITGGTISGITDLAVADGGTGASDASGARTNLGLVIGTNVQAQDAELSAIAGLTSAADRLPYFTGSGTAALATFTSAGRALVDDADAAAQRATLGAAPLAAKYIVQTADSELSAEQALGALSTGILKNTTTTGVLSIAASGTDYAPATSGTSILKGNGSGGFSNASAGTDYQGVDAELTAIAGLTSAADRLPYFTGSGTAALATFTAAGRALVDDANATAQRATLSAAPVGAKYIVQTANSELSAEQALGALATGILKNTTTTGVLSIAAAGTDYAPATSGTSILKGNGSGGFSNAAAGTDYVATTGVLSNQITSSVFSSRPSAANSGRLHFSTDIGIMSRDTGSTWENFGYSDGGLFTAPPTSSWSTTTLGSATFTSERDSYLLTLPAASGDNWRVQYRTLAASSNYTATAYLESSLVDTISCFTGLTLRSSGGALIVFGISYDAGTGGTLWKLTSTKWTSETAYSADYRRIAGTQFTEVPKWLRFRDDGTNRYSEYSFNGLDWLLYHSVGRTDFMTAAQVGFGGNFNATGVTSYVRMRSFKET